MGHLLDALSRAYDALGFPQATGHDEVSRQLVLARTPHRLPAIMKTGSSASSAARPDRQVSPPDRPQPRTTAIRARAFQPP